MNRNDNIAPMDLGVVGTLPGRSAPIDVAGEAMQPVQQNAQRMQLAQLLAKAGGGQRF